MGGGEERSFLLPLCHELLISWPHTCLPHRYDALRPWVNYAPFYRDNVSDIIQVVHVSDIIQVVHPGGPCLFRR